MLSWEIYRYSGICGRYIRIYYPNELYFTITTQPFPFFLSTSYTLFRTVYVRKYFWEPIHRRKGKGKCTLKNIHNSSWADRCSPHIELCTVRNCRLHGHGQMKDCALLVVGLILLSNMQVSNFATGRDPLTYVLSQSRYHKLTRCRSIHVSFVFTSGGGRGGGIYTIAGFTRRENTLIYL